MEDDMADDDRDRRWRESSGGRRRYRDEAETRAGGYGRDYDAYPYYGEEGDYGGTFGSYGRGYDDYGGYDRDLGNYGSGRYGGEPYRRDDRDAYARDLDAPRPGYGYRYSGGGYRRRDWPDYYAGEGYYDRGDYGREGYRGQRGFMDRAEDEVGSWFGSEGAERRRRQDARQGDPSAQYHRGKGPRGYTRSDERILEDVNERLMDDWELDASEIETAVSDCEVMLNGTVNSRRDKRHAEDIAEDVSGVRHVQNNLRVGQQTGAGQAGMAP
jgi:osmotically-inducible protein OsmY